ncbi:membrane protein [Gordonia spumicola]|uniref:Membrane protein n=1 Tax=Gordonia spumicola TaxID=589161 RepID=A0A7I9V983_9ACTN|nr:VIT1/CCC1 transporter family protein [Gordonia spumicola]GEE01966.1 membrane protein [Gordonia spumicola]
MPNALTRWWAEADPGDLRDRLTDVNDGIIALAGTGLGLAGAEMSGPTSFAVLVISALMGAFAVFGVQLGEAMSHREAQQATVEREQRLLELTPDEEVVELASWFEAKGVSPETSMLVATELSDADALSAQLEIEYGIRELTSPGDAWREAVTAGLAFLFGAALPVVAMVTVPLPWRSEATIAVSLVSLAATSVVIARRGYANVLRTAIRSLTIGVAALALGYLLGDWVM